MSEWLPEEALAPLVLAGGDVLPLVCADRALRQLLPLGLEASGLTLAAQAARALPGLLDTETARQSMFGLEKLARAHAAPEQLVRAAHGVCACALSLCLVRPQVPDKTPRAEAQLVSALVRLVTTSQRVHLAPEVALRCLAGQT